jgi:hypothetical protein
MRFRAATLPVTSVDVGVEPQRGLLGVGTGLEIRKRDKPDVAALVGAADAGDAAQFKAFPLPRLEK